jgi:hypothetical protein
MTEMRAGNTVESMKPRIGGIIEVERPENVIQAAPPTPTPDDLDETVPIIALSNSVVHSAGFSPASNDRPMEARVRRLEDLMDGLLDRIASHNVNSAWKI